MDLISASKLETRYCLDSFACCCLILGAGPVKVAYTNPRVYPVGKVTVAVAVELARVPTSAVDVAKISGPLSE